MPGRRAVDVVLGAAGRPAIAVSTASTAPGQHTQPALTAGTATTTSATITNTGASELRHVSLALQAPQGWTSQATSAVSFPAIQPGQTQTVTWSVTPPAGATGGAGLVVSASYDAGPGAATSASAEEWVTTQKPLPLPPGVTDLALSATASASYASPWTTVTAVNNGIYPIQSSDDNDLTPYWGTWPETGAQWIELDWSQPITTNGSSVYFADDGGGVLLPASWTVQYWNGTAFVDVPNPSGYPAADDTFNAVTFDSVTTTKLRVAMQSSSAVGAIQWIDPSIPAGG